MDTYPFVVNTICALSNNNILSGIESNSTLLPESDQINQHRFNNRPKEILFDLAKSIETNLLNQHQRNHHRKTINFTQNVVSMKCWDLCSFRCMQRQNRHPAWTIVVLSHKILMLELKSTMDEKRIKNEHEPTTPMKNGYEPQTIACWTQSKHEIISSDFDDE